LSDNAFWLVGVQLLDGIGAGIYGALFPVIVADLMRGTGRFNVQDYERNLDGALAWGGFIDARSENKQWPFLARAEYRSYGSAPSAPMVRMGSLKACLVQWEIAVFCLDSMMGAGAVNDGTGPHDAWIFSGGFTAGLGVSQPTRDL